MVSLEPGDEVRDTVHDKMVEVVRISDDTAADHYIDAIDQTVLEANPDAAPGEPVVIAHYNDRGRQEYAFPLSRLEVPEA